MGHVHWGLFALSFVAGLAFTLVLMVRPVSSSAGWGVGCRAEFRG
jgi:hypothetical protein